MGDLRSLRLLFQGYLTPDWPEDYDGDPWAAVDDFVASEPSAARSVPAEVETVLSEYSTDDEVRQLVVGELGSGYLPEADGYAYRDWLLQVSRRMS
jgi:CdiI immunity protein